MLKPQPNEKVVGGGTFGRELGLREIIQAGFLQWGWWLYGHIRAQQEGGRLQARMRAPTRN